MDTLTVDVEHHLPEGRPNRLVEPEPHLSASAQGVGAALGGGEEGAAHWRVPATTSQACWKLVKPNPFLLARRRFYDPFAFRITDVSAPHIM